MGQKSYWLDLFTWKTWQEFLAAGATVTGFRESRWTAVKKIKPGDVFLCYLTGVSRFVALLEVTGNPYKDTSKTIWSDESFPCRLPVRLLVALEPETAIPITHLRAQLSIFTSSERPLGWVAWVRASPWAWSAADGEAVAAAIQNGKDNPIPREFDRKKLEYRPKAIKAQRVGTVTIPDDETVRPGESEWPQPAEHAAGEPERAHTEVQYALLKFGSDLGLDVWVARNDKSKTYKGQQFASIPHLRKALPHQFDEATQRTIELIDVLWLKGNAIVAAFEVESTTSIYSGLLRMADLIAMQPNIQIPLYLVAPADRRTKVVTEVNRPTFARLDPPMSEMCRFIAFETLRDGLKKVESVMQFLKPEYVDELSDTCALEDSE